MNTKDREPTVKTLLEGVAELLRNGTIGENDPVVVITAFKGALVYSPSWKLMYHDDTKTLLIGGQPVI